MKNLYLFVMVLFLFASCDKRINQCKKATDNFFAAIVDGDEDAMLEFYPMAYQLDYFPNTDSHKNNSVKKISDKRYVVNLTNTYTKAGNKINKDISLYLEPVNDDTMKIVDSKGLYPKDREKLYKYAYRHNMIPKGCETDQQLGAVADSVRDKLVSIIMKMQYRTYDYFEVSNINWQKLLDSASGAFLVTNKSNFTLHAPKYKLKYYNNRDEVVATDEGYITYSDFKPRDLIKVDFFTNHIGNANSVQVKINIELEETLENILDNN